MPFSRVLNSFMSSTSWSLMSLIMKANFGTDTRHTSSAIKERPMAE